MGKNLELVELSNEKKRGLLLKYREKLMRQAAFYAGYLLSQQLIGKAVI
jgi:hypothetical protein